MIQLTAEPFIQVIVDLQVPRMAFGRSCLIGDAAFALRPHIGVGTAKAADDAWQLGTAPTRSHRGICPRSAQGLGDSTTACGPARTAKGPRRGSQLAGRHLAGRRAAPVRAAGAWRQRSTGRRLTLPPCSSIGYGDRRMTIALVDLLEVTEGLRGNAEHGGQHPRWKPADGLTNADVVLVFRRAGVLDDD